MENTKVELQMEIKQLQDHISMLEKDETRLILNICRLQDEKHALEDENKQLKLDVARLDCLNKVTTRLYAAAKKYGFDGRFDKKED